MAIYDSDLIAQKLHDLREILSGEPDENTALLIRNCINEIDAAFGIFPGGEQ